MHAVDHIPDLALARVVTAGGPYRPGDDLSLAFTTPTVSRLVAHDTNVRAKCVPHEGALVPDMISVVITHAAAPYASGDMLTLSFVDPRVARVHISAERRERSGISHGSTEPTACEEVYKTLDAAMAEATSEGRDFQTEAFHFGAPATTPSETVTAATAPSTSVSGVAPDERPAAQTAPAEPRSAQSGTPENVGAPMREETPTRTIDREVSSLSEGAGKPAQLGAGERMTLQEEDFVAHDGARNATVREAPAKMCRRATAQRRPRAEQR